MRFAFPAVTRALWRGSVGLVLAVGFARADVAVLRPLGPKSGGGFSNPGLAFNSPGNVPVAMRSARVAIHLARGGADELVAKCEAVFELENFARVGDASEFLVAFPVTGQATNRGERSPLRIIAFDVAVDDTRPPLVRRDIDLKRHPIEFRDDVIRGKLEGRVALPHYTDGTPDRPERPDAKNVWHPFITVGYDRKDFYVGAYLWPQRLAPGLRQKVVVTYSLALRSQRIAFPEMSYDRFSGAIFPEKIATLDKSRRYFFFDYVLRSGATWEGKIGRETITLTAEPGVKIDGLVSFGREARREGGAWVWEIVNEDPTEDVLVALPL